MDMRTRSEEKTLVLTLSGKLDAVTAPVYEQRTAALIAAEPRCLVVDFERLEYISSAGLGVLLATAKRFKEKGGQIRCANVKGAVKEVFDLSGFSAIFPLHDSVAGALAAAC